MEYYYRERLGFEAGYILYRSPFAKKVPGWVWISCTTAASGVYLRQKFYQPDDNLGMFILRTRCGLPTATTAFRLRNATAVIPYRRILQADENLFEYSIMVGDRWMPDPGAQGLTIEGFLGIGFGYRHYRQQWTDSFP